MIVNQTIVQKKHIRAITKYSSISYIVYKELFIVFKEKSDTGILAELVGNTISVTS